MTLDLNPATIRRRGFDLDQRRIKLKFDKQNPNPNPKTFGHGANLIAVLNLPSRASANSGKRTKGPPPVAGFRSPQICHLLVGAPELVVAPGHRRRHTWIPHRIRRVPRCVGTPGRGRRSLVANHLRAPPQDGTTVARSPLGSVRTGERPCGRRHR
jgi:hypothetical protein